MHLELNKKNILSVQLLFLAFFIVFTFFLWQAHKGFSLWDEGFLWYGAQRVMLGDVPIRDFMAYDPGRYYWSATLMHLWGDNGIISLRLTLAIFQATGLYVGLLLIARHLKKSNFLFLMITALVLVTWMIPRHKLFDVSISIISISILSILAQSPTQRNYFFTGLCIGAIAIFGRNHAMYAVAGSLFTMLLLCINQTGNVNFFKGLYSWFIGILIGFSPVVFMLIFVPGFTKAFWESIQFLFQFKATNIALPIPLPWLVNYRALPLLDSIRSLLIGLFFMVLSFLPYYLFVGYFAKNFSTNQYPQYWLQLHAWLYPTPIMPIQERI
jgi:hypothetical protein